MSKVQKEFVTLPLDEIIPYENNPRHNDDAVPDIVASIEQVGDLDPIEIDENNIILSGHTRLKALKQLGEETTDVVRYTGLTEDQKKKYRLLANKTGEKATWDMDLLAEELEGLDFDGYDFGFDIGDDFEPDTEAHQGNPTEQFLYPPFSIIRGDKADWAERKKAWQNFGIRSELGRG